ncbi:MAG: winged helix-turn-helix domain-containing tetratricopeptide repeat protein [Caulobacteraceae bacterium]
MSSDRGPQADASQAPIELAREADFRLGALSIEPALRRLAHPDGREEIVQPRVMQVLVALARAEGRILTRDDLQARCWSGVVVGEDAITRVLGRLRRLSETIGRGEFALQTIAKVGYRLTRGEPTLSPRATERPSDAPDVRPRVCVLPFLNLSDDREQEYFSDGISEDIITDLSKVSALQVTARNTAFTFKGKAVEVTEVASKLKVSHVLEGSVRKAGNRVRITAQLIDGATGNHQWAERYDRDLTDIFALQDEISKAIVAALKLKLLPEEKRAIERRGTDNAEAYDLYLMARQHLIVGGGVGDRGRLETILRLTRMAVEIDPEYARAWALLGISQISLRFSYGRSDFDSWEGVKKALAIGPDLAEAHAVNAYHLRCEGRLEEALAEVLTALDLDPQSYEANRSAASTLYMMGRFAAAIPFLEKAIALIAPDFFSSALLVNCHVALGRPELARQKAKESLASAEAAASKDPNFGMAIACGANALAALGETQAARDWISRALQIDPDDYWMRYHLARIVSFHLRDADGAIELLGPVFAKAYDAHARIVPDFEPIRKNGRFATMLDEAEARMAGIERTVASGRPPSPGPSASSGSPSSRGGGEARRWP